MEFKRTVKELIDLVGVRYLEYYLTNDYSEYPDHLYKPKTYTLDEIIEGDYLYISLHGHDGDYLLYSFDEEQLENELEHLKEFIDNCFVNDQWIIHRDKVLYWSKHNEDTKEYELVSFK